MIQTIKEWLNYEIGLAMANEDSHRRMRRYGHAQQQADFRAALEKVLSKINLMERTE